MPNIKKKKVKVQPPFSVKQFNDNRNKVLITRGTGGLGDILMHRMMFEDFKILSPDTKIVFACPPRYFESISDHPFVDEVVDCRDVDPHEYVVHYNTTTVCNRHEHALAPLSGPHRSDIWARHCGVKLTSHDMHLSFDDEMQEYAENSIADIRNREGPKVVLCPYSAMTAKNLQPNQQKIIIEELHRRGCFVFATHHRPMPEIEALDCPVLHNLSMKQWMAVVNASDYVVTVDSAGFHCGGGLNKPMLGIFSIVDGKVYGKYFDFILVQKHRDNGDWDCGPCYWWSCCPKSKGPVKPCMLELDQKLLLEGIDRLFEKWPIQ